MELEDDRSYPENIIIRRETVQCVSEAIEKLSDIYRDVFILKRIQGFSNEEIAKLFNISVETVKKRLVRSKKLILTYLKEMEVDLYEG